MSRLNALFNKRTTEAARKAVVMKNPLWEQLIERPRKFPWHIDCVFSRHGRDAKSYGLFYFKRKRDRDAFERQICRLYNEEFYRGEGA